MDLSGQTVLITGANRGLGACLVTEALARGAEKVYAVTRTPFTHTDERVINVVADLTDPAGVQRVIGGIDKLDVVVNNAGVAVADDAEDAALLRQHLEVNLFGPHAVVQAALPALVRAKGALVNVLSIAALAPAPIITSYSISKAAAFSLTQALRNRLAGQGVRVHAALPGPIDTEMSRDLDAPKTPPAAVAAAIFDGVAAGEEDIFPDPMSAMFSTGWADSPTKAFERAQAEYVTV
jgi:NAD(P)-dependent dehydrogenase (short-subunit alcohol dehydrogenase family)